MIEYNKDVTDIILRVLADIDLAYRWRSEDDSGEFIERLVQLEERSIQVFSLEEKIIILQNQLTSLRNGLRSHKNINKEPEELPFQYIKRPNNQLSFTSLIDYLVFI